jgi:hypothetical protein
MRVLTRFSQRLNASWCDHHAHSHLVVTTATTPTPPPPKQNALQGSARSCRQNRISFPREQSRRNPMVPLAQILRFAVSEHLRSRA